MDFSVDFFRDEVRNGFYVPTAIKQAWAAALTVLGEIDRICEKYDITYFADWGTILGAVRHGGFVPWDDDLDICMKRDDYVRFRQVADAELPKEFVIHDYARKEDHWLFLARVVNRNQICFEEEHLRKYHNFPYMIGVDIFLQDYLYDEEEQERERCEEVKRLIAVADGIVEHSMQRATVEHMLAEIGQSYGVHLNPEQDDRSLGVALYRLAEQQMARVPKEKSGKVGQIFPWILKGGQGLPKELYEKMVRLPFEQTTIPVPAYYNRILQSRYGNYLEIHKVWNGHDYPFFEAQRENLRKVADFALPEFTFSPEMLTRKPAAEGSLKEIAKECMEQLHGMTQEACRLLQGLEAAREAVDEGIRIADEAPGGISGEEETEKSGAAPAVSFQEGETVETVLTLLPDCQQLAVDFATLVEETRGTERKSCQLVTEKVQAYCDVLYEIFLSLTEGGQEEPEEDCGEQIQEEADGSSGKPQQEEADGSSGKPRQEVANGSSGKPQQEGANDGSRKLQQAVCEVLETVGSQILERGEILFLPVGPVEWKGFEPLYEKAVREDQSDIFVVPLPVLFKDPFGRITAGAEEIAAAVREEDYPPGVPLSAWPSYDLALHHPDRIYIQNPYDGENPCLSVPPRFYARSLQGYTEELIYLPAFRTDEFGEEDYNDIYNMKHYVTAPGVIYADRVVVQSEQMRGNYLEKLMAFAGEETREHWEKSVCIASGDNERYLEAGTDHAGDNGQAPDAATREPYHAGNGAEEGETTDASQRRKQMLYCIGLNELSEFREQITESVRSRMEIFRENRDRIGVTVCLYPSDEEEWLRTEPETAGEVLDLLAAYREEDWYDGLELRKEQYDDLVAGHDAYYGSPSPLVPLFVHEKKPVMISDYGVTE